MSRIETILKLKESKIIPLFYHDDEDVCLAIVDACYTAGLRAFEFTNRGKYSYDNFRKIKHAVENQYKDMALGIGSITDSATAALYMQAGADFIVSPVLNEDIIKACNRRKILCLPGCATLSEISKAEELGAEIVKLFPAELTGPAFLTAIKAPMPWTSIMPSGGVDLTEESLTQWFKAGAYCVGMGSKLITKEIIQNKDYKKLVDAIRWGRQIIEDIPEANDLRKKKQI
ncbi:MAG: bifunctional 4-hydroxy-2-oxoglutarate aldolase/2-dehydro-3-deoxy-phosphogluconate aldolase [Cytophagaceae bacterium]